MSAWIRDRGLGVLFVSIFLLERAGIDVADVESELSPKFQRR
jgi:hypothetical protein